MIFEEPSRLREITNTHRFGRRIVGRVRGAKPARKKLIITRRAVFVSHTDASRQPDDAQQSIKTSAQ